MPVDIERLIAAVLVRTPLWDKKHQSYHNRCLIDKKWDEISKELNEERENLKKKWKQLRDSLRQELKKIPTEGCDDPSSYTTWPYFQSMLFLKDQMKSRKSRHSVKLNSENSADFIKEELDDEHHDDIFNMMENKRYPYKMNKKRKLHNMVANSEFNLLEQKSQTTRDRDEDLAFFESLLPHVRHMDPPKKLLCRMEIQKIVYNYAYNLKTSKSDPFQVVSETATSSHLPNIETEYKIETSLPECQAPYLPVPDSVALQSSTLNLQDYKYDANILSFTGPPET